jgi:4a-hydroxytetrahydrobiopterin dehydratase
MQRAALKLLDPAELKLLPPIWELVLENHAPCKLKAAFVFPDFSAAFGFMTRTALEAERANHHPDWSNVYNKVFVELQTHDAKGVTSKDLELARKMWGFYAPFAASGGGNLPAAATPVAHKDPAAV